MVIACCQINPSEKEGGGQSRIHTDEQVLGNATDVKQQGNIIHIQ